MRDLASALQHGRETTSVDFKERLNWHSGGRSAQIEILRDVVGLVNREGGSIIIGAHDRGDGSFELVGLQDDDILPDPTGMGDLLRQYFDPTTPIAIGPREEGGLTFGLIEVPRFTVSPLIAVRDFNDAGGRVRLADGDLLVRTDALTTEKVKGRDLRAMLDRAISTRAVQLGALLPPIQTAADLAPSRRDWGDSVSGSRLLELDPMPIPAARPLREVEALVKDAAVQSRSGSVLMPPDLPLGGYGTRLIRETGRVIAQGSTGGGESERDEEVSTAEFTTTLRARIREVPWERHSNNWNVPEPDLPRPIDLTGLTVLTTAGVLFARRLYSAAAVPRFGFRIGVATPAGHRLKVDGRHFWGLNEAYVGTSRATIWVERECEVAALESEDTRLSLGRDILDELLYYFGLNLEEKTFQAQVKHITEYGGVPI
jgi:hypothetical protein